VYLMQMYLLASDLFTVVWKSRSIVLLIGLECLMLIDTAIELRVDASDGIPGHGLECFRITHTSLSTQKVLFSVCSKGSL
jgi:hypothetical protein